MNELLCDKFWHSSMIFFFSSMTGMTGSVWQTHAPSMSYRSRFAALHASYNIELALHGNCVRSWQATNHLFVVLRPSLQPQSDECIYWYSIGRSSWRFSWTIETEFQHTHQSLPYLNLVWKLSSKNSKFDLSMMESQHGSIMMLRWWTFSESTCIYNCVNFLLGCWVLAPVTLMWRSKIFVCFELWMITFLKRSPLSDM